MATQVFISYRQTNQEQIKRVRVFAEKLRRRGVNVILDQFYLDIHPEGPSNLGGWPGWSAQQASQAPKVIIVGDKAWFDCFLGTAPPGEGLGAAYEAKVLRNRLYKNPKENPDIRIAYFRLTDVLNVPDELYGYHRFDAHGDFERIVRWLGGRVQCAFVSGRMTEIPRSRLSSEFIYRYRLFILAAKMRADRRWEYHHTEEVDNAPPPARSRLNVALSLFPISFVVCTAVVALGQTAIVGYVFPGLHAFIAASAVSTLMFFLAVCGRLLWFWRHCCSIEVLLKWAATSELNFEDMIELRKSAQDSHFKSITETLKRIYRELGRADVINDLEMVRLPGVEGVGGELAAFKLAPLKKTTTLDLAFESDPLVFKRERGQIAKSSIQRWTDPYDLRVQTGVWNDLLGKWWAKEREGADQGENPHLKSKILSDIFEKLSISRQPEYDAYAARHLKPGRRDGLNYCLNHASVNTEGKLELVVQTAEYGDIMDSCDALVDEALVFGYLAQGLSLSPRSSLRKMPWRMIVFDNARRDVQKMLCEPSHRAAGIGVSCFTTYRCSVRDKDNDLEVMASALADTMMDHSLGDSVRYGLNTLRSDKIGTYPDKLHVVPAGMFGCFQEHGTYQTGDLTRVVVKEMFEEVFNVKEAQDWLGYDRPEFDQAFQNLFCGAGERSDWKPEIRFIGLCFDMLNLRPELCFHWDIPSPLWDRVFVRSRRAPIEAKGKNRHEKLKDLIADYDELVHLCRKDPTKIGKNERAKALSDRIRVEFNYESAKASSHPLIDDEFANPLLERWVQSGLACAAMALTTEENDEQN